MSCYGTFTCPSANECRARVKERVMSPVSNPNEIVVQLVAEVQAAQAAGMCHCVPNGAKHLLRLLGSGRIAATEALRRALGPASEEALGGYAV